MLETRGPLDTFLQRERFLSMHLAPASSTDAFSPTLTSERAQACTSAEEEQQAATAGITMQRIAREGKGNAEGAEGSRVTRQPRGEKEERKGRGGQRRAEEYSLVKERAGEGKTGSEASERRQDRRRQPAITSWNVWERVGLDPKGPTTTKSRGCAPRAPLHRP